MRRQKTSSRPHQASSDWVAGMVQVPINGIDQTTEVTTVWLRGIEVLDERVVPMEPEEAQGAVMSGFLAAVVKAGRMPGRVRVSGEGMAQLLHRILPPTVSVVRAPAPEVLAFLDARSGAPGEILKQLPTESTRFVELPPFPRIAAELYATKPWLRHAPGTALRLRCSAIGLEDAAVVVEGPNGNDLPTILIFHDGKKHEEIIGRSRGAALTLGDLDLPCYLISYARPPAVTDEEREVLRSQGWSFPEGDPNLRPMAGFVDKPSLGMRAPSDSEYETLCAAAFALVAMLDEPMEIDRGKRLAWVSFVLKLAEHRLANVRLTWPFDLYFASAFNKSSGRTRA